MNTENEKNDNSLMQTANFIHSFIKQDLMEETNNINTRFPPEPNGYLHLGHAKSICLNFGIAKQYGGKCNLRFDDTNPTKENEDFVKSIKEDVKWLGFDWEDRLFFASDYFDKMYECAVELIKKGKAFVCDMTFEQIKESRGSLTKKGTESPFRNRSIEENLELFEKMKNGEFKDGEKTLRAKIDMASPNMNMRDPVIYRISHAYHHNTKDKWCIYPMYDFAHPLEDAFEKITHSLCTMEFEDHRPIYNWVIDQFDFEVKPRQIEFAKLNLKDTKMGKRFLRTLVEDGKVDGWDDPRLLTISGIRRRGYTKESIRTFCETIGVSKADSVVDIAVLEHCLREDLKTKVNVIMAILNPIKVVITNYPEGQEEELEIENNPENPELGSRKVIFSREIFIEHDDFLENAPKKFFRLTPGKEVRLKGAYFILCNDVIKDENGNIIEIHCTYDPKTKSGTGFNERKVKGTIHWVCAKHAIKATVNLYENLNVFDTDSNELIENPNSLKVLKNVFIESCVKNFEPMQRVQFIRNGYFITDSKNHSKENIVFNRIVPLKSSFK